MNDETKLPALQSGGAIRAIIPQTFEEAWRIGNAVVVAGMAPYGLQTPEKATVAILHGMEIGMPPMASLQSIAIINGRPCIWGDGALGLVQGSGKMETFKEWMDGEGDKRVAFCRVMRRGDPEPKVGKFSVTDAKTALLWEKRGRDGSATPWVTYPERMLKMRARAWALRDGFADVLKGLAIVEEFRDIEHDPNEVVQQKLVPPKPPAKETVKTIEAAKEEPKKEEPKPKAKPKAKPKPEPEPEQEEVGSASFEDESQGDDGPSPSDLLSALDMDLETATNEAEVEEIWNDHDLESRLESLPMGAEFQSVAAGIRRKHLGRVGG